jgi:preprotein translocase subunit YajC
MWTDAIAQGTGGAPAANPNMGLLLQLPYFVVIFLIFYLLIIRPQQQQKKKQELMIKALKKGDRVLTTGGMLGTVVGVDDAKVVLKIADDVKAEFTKSAVVQVIPADAH